MTDEREQALQYAARLRGLSLLRTGDTFALVRCLVADASLDQIAAYLAADDGDERAETPGDRRADLRAMLKAEHALLVDMEREKSRASGPSRDRATTEAALADIRRRIAEIQSEMGRKGPP